MKNPYIVGLVVTVVGGLILKFIPNTWEPFVASAVWVWSMVVAMWNLIIASYLVPGWVIAIGFLSTLLLVFAFVRSKMGSKDPDHYQYTSDTVKGLFFRWRWLNNRIDQLCAYCKSCDAVLVTSYDKYLMNKSTFTCENCNREVGAIQGSPDYISQMVEREIIRRIRTDKYQGK